MNHLARILPKAFFSSVCQFVLFKLILAMYLVWIPWPPIWWSGVVTMFIIPFISGYICCRMMHPNHFHFDLHNAVSKLSIYRLAIRILPTLCFIVIGFVAEIFRSANPELSVNLLVKLGINNDVIHYALFYFVHYIVTAFFTTTYAVVEFLFVSPTQE